MEACLSGTTGSNGCVTDACLIGLRCWVEGGGAKFERGVDGSTGEGDLLLGAGAPRSRVSREHCGESNRRSDIPGAGRATAEGVDG